MLKKKICLVGAFAVGKTSLVRRFVHGIFRDRYLTTIGVKIEKKVVEGPSGPVQLNVWDLAGEDDLVAVRTTYLRGASGYILVVDGTRPETVDVACDLKTRILEEVGSIPFVVVANKDDLVDEWTVDDRALAAAAVGAEASLRTSARSGEGVEDLFSRLAEVI